MHKMRFVMPLAVLALVLLAGCAKPPVEAIAAAKQALSQAQAAEAAEWAPDALRTAQADVDKLDKELAVQEDKFAIMRSYKEAEVMAATAKTSGETAATEAAAAKEKARLEAVDAITAARAAAEEARGKVATAPVGKGNQADIDAMKSDLMGVDASINEADQAMQAQQYRQAKSQADAASSAARNISSMVDQAIEMRAASKKGGKK